MPRYDYLCPSNGRVVEVQHGMRDSLATWREVCERAGIEAGDTPGDAPVQRQLAAAMVMGAAGSGPSAGFGPMGGGGGCASGGCGCH